MVARGVLVDDLAVVAGAHAGTAVDGGAGRDGAGGEIGVPPEVRVGADGALEAQRVVDLELTEHAADQAPLVPLVGDLGDVGEGVLQLLAQDGPQVPIAVGVLRGKRRIEVHGGEDAARAGADGAVLGPVDGLLHPRHAHIRAHAEAVAHLAVQVEAQTIALESGVDDDAVLVEVVPREEIAGLGVSAGERDRMVLLGRGSQQQVRVVVRLRARDLLRGIARRAAAVDVGFVDQRHVLRRSEHGNPLADVLRAVARLQCHAIVAALAALGGDQHHPIGAARAVHGRGRGVLQDLDRLDVAGIDLVERVIGRVVGIGALHCRQPVDHVERLAVGADRSGTAHAHARARAGDAAVDYDLDTSGFALERVRDRAGRGRHVLAAHRGHGAGEVPLLDGAVADGHHGLELHGLLLQREVRSGGLPRHHDDTRIHGAAVANEPGPDAIRAGRHVRDRVPASSIGGGLEPGADHRDAGAGERRTGFL